MRWSRLVLIVAALALLAAGASGAHADTPPASLFASDNERFGFGVTTDVAHYDLAPLHAGWYVNWGAADLLAHPEGLDFAQIVRTGERITPDLTTLARIARANPGSLWLVGNEPDCIWQDNTLPERYAEQYHDVFFALKAADPTARVAIGGVVQATPLRFQWLDRVWSSYQQRYGQTMPVDVWNVHNFILREKSGSWGCEIPPGVDATQGMLYHIEDHDNMEYFRQQIVAFRQWMAGKGQRNKPLIVSEYGILFHEALGYDYARVRSFMLASFDFFMTATDAQTGYPADGNRLVQRWAWYSLDDPSFEQQMYTTWSALYNPFPPYEIRQLGSDFGAYAGARLTPYVDLAPARLEIAPAGILTYGAPATLTLRLTLRNDGNMASPGPVPVEWWEDGALLGSAAAQSVPRRYAGERQASLSLSTVITSPRTISARLDPAGSMAESNRSNNVITATLREWADVTAGSLSPTPTAGAALTLTATITNTGTMRLEGVESCFFGARLGYPETLLGCVTTPLLRRGLATTLSLAWAGLAPGFYRARLVADASGRIFEPNESDNVAGANFAVGNTRLYLPQLSGAGNAR